MVLFNMCTEKEFVNIKNMIRSFNKVTNLFIVYNVHTKIIILNDLIGERTIRSYCEISLSDFKNLLSEMGNMKLWNSDFEIDMKVII